MQPRLTGAARGPIVRRPGLRLRLRLRLRCRFGLRLGIGLSLGIGIGGIERQGR